MLSLICFSTAHSPNKLAPVCTWDGCRKWGCASIGSDVNSAANPFPLLPPMVPCRVSPKSQQFLYIAYKGQRHGLHLMQDVRQVTHYPATAVTFKSAEAAKVVHYPDSPVLRAHRTNRTDGINSALGSPVALSSNSFNPSSSLNSCIPLLFPSSFIPPKGDLIHVVGIFQIHLGDIRWCFCGGCPLA